MRALLVNPHKLVPSSWSITQIASPPLGLAYIAGELEKQGFEVSVFDCIAEDPDHYFQLDDIPGISAQGIAFDEICHRLEPHYDLIGLALMFTNNWLANRHLVNLLKERYPDTLIVGGGEHVSAIPEYCLKDCHGLDVVVCGEGEETISELAGLLKEGKSFSAVEGIVYKVRGEKDEIIRNPKRTRIREVDNIELPAWHLFPIQKYFDNEISCGVAYGRSLPIMATRGCPYECTFCSSPQMWGTKYTMRDVESVVAEMKRLNCEFGITNFNFYDLTAIINKRWILDICAAIKREGLVITWQIPAGTRSEVINYEVAVALKESGCKNITYAPESGSGRMLALIKKKVVIPRMLNSIDQSYRAGLDVKLNIIMGFPDEKVSDIFKTYWFLVRASYYGATDASPSMFSPYPGSALFAELTARNELVLTDKYFQSIVFSQSLHKIINYNRNYSKRMMTFLLLFGYVVFYISNFCFRPVRAFRMFTNMVTKKYQTRGEYMLGEILKRRRAIKSAGA